MHFVCELLGCTPQQFYGFFLFFIVGIFGMVTHWAKKWLREETKTGCFSYLFKVNKRYTAMAVLTYFGAIAALLSLGTVDFSSPQSMGLSFMAGYMIDSAINKDIAP